MDVIKTSLIFAIAITLYYLLLQWPVNTIEEPYIEEIANQSKVLNDSEQLLSETLSPLSSSSKIEPVAKTDESSYFEIQNDDLSLLIDSRTGRFFASQLKNISETKGSEEGFMVLGRTYNADSGGENIYCSEVEEVIYQNPKILEATVFGIPHPVWGEQVHATVVPRDTSLTESELIDFCRNPIL